MFAIAFLFLRVLCNCFKSRRRLEVEVLVLRHQLNVLQQRAPRRLYLTWANRALFVWLYRGFPHMLDAVMLREPALGCAAHPRRTSEARLRRRPVDSLEVLVPRRGRPSQTWKTFLHNHADGIASIDLFVVPTIAFEQLF